jgi:hypothetical protein
MGSPGIAFPDAQSFVGMSFANENLSKQQAFEGIVGCSTALMETLDLVRTVAPTDSTVLIEGETGTGKEVIASAIHACSKRRDRAFIKLNCTAIPVGLLESELFGHEKGAFTGAVSRKIGRFEAAHGGTLFLDEIGDIPLETAAETAARIARGRIREVGEYANAARKRAFGGSYQWGPGKADFRKVVSQRSLLPPQRISDIGAATTRPRRRHPFAGDTLCRQICCSNAESNRRDSSGSDGHPYLLFVAGKYPRAAELHRVQRNTDIR